MRILDDFVDGKWHSRFCQMVKTFENQEKLPRLPVPPLENTIKVYLKSIKPHLPPSEHRKYSGICRDFQQKLGPILQSRLVAYEKTQENSWLENWWINLAYLSWRTSILVHSNWYMVLKDLPGISKQLPFTEGISDFQIKRAAGYAYNLLNLKDSIENGDLPAESTKQGPIDMHQYSRVFGVTRVPKPNSDILVGDFPCRAKHILVHIRDQIFTVPVYYENGKRLRIAHLEKLFKSCLDQSLNSERQLPIGILTAQDRDPWAKDYAYLENLNPTNKESFSLIQSALFSVCLDHRLMLPDISSMAKNVFHGFDGHNRWFDKSISVIVTNDGRLGINGEHSPCDALVPALLLDAACAKYFFLISEPAKDRLDSSADATIPQIKHLKFVGDNVIKESLCNAQVFINQTIADSDVKVKPLSSHGSNFIKQMGKVSPDAYMQMALQLTFYRIHGYCAAVYETAATRKFLHGRTETCRSLTPEQQEFVENFDRPISVTID